MAYYERREYEILPPNPKVVVFGGGTGLSTLLAGLKKYTKNITAVVTVADDGGGSGILRKEMRILPPGDIRNCLIALSNTDSGMEKLLRHRFKEGSLSGQSFGNLFIAAMCDIYGSFEAAIKEASNVLAITGKVLPMTLEDVCLCAVLKDGSRICGESMIPMQVKEKESAIAHVELEPDCCEPLDETFQAIEEADLIAFGPGSLYTSILPNLLVSGICDAIRASRAVKLYNLNIMTQPGETDGYTLIDHLEVFRKHGLNLDFDAVTVNDGVIESGLRDKYRSDGAELIVLKDEDVNFCKERGIQIYKQDLIAVRGNYVRHEGVLLGRLMLKVLNDISHTKVYRKR